MIRPKTPHSHEPLVPLPLPECLAKTIKKDEKNILEGMDVPTHCLIAGYVARELINRLPDWLRNTLFPQGSELVAAAHDVGKISPFFQEKIHRALRTQKHPHGRTLGLGNPDLDKTIGGHAAVSQVAVDRAGRYIPEIIGRHHGYSSFPDSPADAEKYGGPEWQKQRIQLLNVLKEALHADWPIIDTAIHADALAGLTCVADWISSGKFFDTIAMLQDNEKGKWEQIVSQALDSAGFVRPQIRKGLSFEKIFGFKQREIQHDLVKSVSNAGIYILEAPMGIGKTEAAFYAAYKALEENRATGIYFALPTQLTSDKVHERMNKFLAAILEDNWLYKKSLLLHSSAWLKQTELGEEGEPGRSWFDSGKRGLLAPFAVGTIDQALMAAMNVKHGFVRTFGLAGKVVILDEVHSYDGYTETLIDQLVEVLRKIHCTVIILSATLTQGRRQSLLFGNKNDNLSSPAISYPLVCALPEGGTLFEIATIQEVEATVQLKTLQGNSDAIEEALLRAERGELVLWIENTIAEAQELFKILGARANGIGVECGLLHSRFLKVDREINENRWVGLFGKAGNETRRLNGRILVGTQVLEQSLDIDADFLISRICPTDMLLQRMGRLWRHRENNSIRPIAASRAAWILAPMIDDAIANQEAFGKTANVYASYVLCRTLEVWQGREKVIIPSQIRDLLETTYYERQETNQMAGYKLKVEQEREKLSRLALVGIARNGKTLPESKATTRYSDVATCEVLLFRSKQHEADGTHLRLLDGSTIVLCNEPKQKGRDIWRSAAATLQRNTVRVYEYLAPGCTREQMDWLKDYVYLGDYEETPFRAAFVQASGELIGLDQTLPLNGYTLSYNSTLGYVAKKINESSSFE